MKIVLFGTKFEFSYGKDRTCRIQNYYFFHENCVNRKKYAKYINLEANFWTHRMVDNYI